MAASGSSIPFCGVAVMAKASHAGKTKTRLCPPLTHEEAAAFNTAFLKDIADNLMAASEETSLAGSMAFGPPGSEAFFRAHLPETIALHEVWYPDFGRCLLEALKGQFAAGYSGACVLNSDSPTLPVEFLIEMVAVLAKAGDRAVLGPSTDGGYYLLACKTIHPRLFEDIAWSTETVAEQTCARAAEIGLPVHILPEWYDIDDCSAIRFLAEELLEGRRFSPGMRGGRAQHSLALLKSMFAKTNLRERLEQFAPSSGFGPATHQEALA